MNIEVEFPEQQQMNNDEFNIVIFPINREFPTIVAAKTEAFKFGGIYNNVPFVVGRSDPARGYLTLTCKHYGVPRIRLTQCIRKQNADTMDTIVKILSLSTSNATEVIMTVRY
ncbi:hypothetical protein BD770DRAFT_448458 [Pilaira anomala]|nr:hypothetical protein BD770DRAFT_448458 [Pilaira anomala]